MRPRQGVAVSAKEASSAGGAAQVTPSGYDIAADLLAEGLGRRPLPFIAEACEEGESQGRGFIQRDGSEVEQMAFDGEGCIGEGGPGADVGDGVEADLVRGIGVRGAGRNLHAANVDARSGDEAIVACKIDSGDSEAAADAAALCRRAQDGKRPSQQPARAAHITRGDELANATAGDIHAAHPERLIDVDGKAELDAERPQLIDASLRAEAEAEVIALVHFDGAQLFE